MTVINRTSTRHEIEVKGLAGRIGAVLEGVDLKEQLTAEQVDAIRQSLLAHKVIFFRQQHLDDEAQQQFASRLGDLTIAHPTVESAAGQPNVFELDSLDGGRANNWHTDVTFTDRPPTASVLRAVIIPKVGGDTVWANTVAAYADLPPALRALADQLRAIHTNQYDYGRKADRGVSAHGATADAGNGKRARQFVATVFETEHPVVRVHPETGDRSLLLGGFARQIIGLSSSESADLIRTLQHHVTKPENTVRWNWRVGDVAVWDNRATQHYAINDYGDQRRQVRRVTVAGSIPVGIDGVKSVALTGDAAFYSTVAA